MATSIDSSTVARCDMRASARAFQLTLPSKIENDDDAMMYIRAIDMILLKEKLMETHSWTEAQADQVEQRYKNWLFLRRKYPGELMPPPEDIDQIWHAHILDTYAYHRDTAALFGGYFHHFPYFGRRGKADRQKLEHAFEDTKRRWKEEFEEDLTGSLSPLSI